MTGHVLFEFLPAAIFFMLQRPQKNCSPVMGTAGTGTGQGWFVFYKYGKEKVAEYFQEIFREIKLSSIQARAVAYPAFRPPAIKLQPDPNQVRILNCGRKGMQAGRAIQICTAFLYPSAKAILMQTGVKPLLYFSKISVMIP
jgi:hypothetical protein